MRVREHPSLNFNIDPPAFHATYAEHFAYSRNAGDSIFIRISKDEYQRKITGTLPPSFWDKIGVGSRHVEIYELTTQDQLCYLRIPNYEYVQRMEYRSVFWMCVVFMIGGTIWYRWMKRKERAK